MTAATIEESQEKRGERQGKTCRKDENVSKKSSAGSVLRT